MATKRKADVNPIDLRTKITMYAPQGAVYHTEGEEIQINPTQKDKFVKLGYSLEKKSKPSLKDK